MGIVGARKGKVVVKGQICTVCIMHLCENSNYVEYCYF